MINPQQMMDEIIRPILGRLGADSPAAANLVLGTLAQESRLEYVRQVGGGPALGVGQMEPFTHDDIWRSWLAERPWYRDQLLKIASLDNQQDGEVPVAARELVTNLAYAVAMTRVFYLRIPEALPDADNIEALADYWKRHYNTHLGAGEPAEFVESFGLVEDAKVFAPAE